MKKKKREVLNGLLRKLAHYVQVNCNGLEEFRSEQTNEEGQFLHFFVTLFSKLVSLWHGNDHSGPLVRPAHSAAQSLVLGCGALFRSRWASVQTRRSLR